MNTFRRRIKYAIVTVFVLILCRALAMYPVYRNTLQEYFGIGDRTWGFLLSINTGAGLLTVLLGGALVDRWGPRRVIRLVLTGIATSMVVMAICGNNWVLFAVSLALYGMMIRPLVVAVSSYLVRLFPDNRRRILSLNFAGTSVGGLLYPALAECLLGVSRSVPAITFAMVFHGPFAIAGLMGFGATALYRHRTSLGKRETEDEEEWEWKDLLVAPRCMPLIGLLVLHAMADSTIYLWMSRFLGSHTFSSQPIGPGYVVSSHAVAYIVSRSLLAFIPENFGRRAFMVLPGLIGGMVFIAGLLSRNYWFVAGGYFLGAFLWSVEYPAMLSTLADEQSEKFGAAMALLQLMVSAGVFISLNGMGILVEYVGEGDMWKAMLMPASLFPIIGMGAGLWVTFLGREMTSNKTDD